jgi:hypothetical protein
MLMSMNRVLAPFWIAALAVFGGQAAPPVAALDLFADHNLSGWELVTPDKTATLATACTFKSDSEKPAGEWNACDITCRAGTLEVRINGVLQNRVTQRQPAAGRIGFQLEGTPFELRRVTLTPLTD